MNNPMNDKTPLELARELEGLIECSPHVHGPHTPNVLIVCKALIEKEMPVDGSKEVWRLYGKYPCCGNYGISDKPPSYCEHCGKAVTWK